MKKGIQWVVKDPKKENVWWPSEEMKKYANISDPNIYDEAAKDPLAFWAKMAKEHITWYKEFDKIYEENMPFYKWFVGGKLNVCYNAVDRHVENGRRNKAAIIWEPEPIDEPARVLTYNDLYREVNKFANVLKKLGVKKGDRVSIYLPMIPEVQIAMLACARIGAPHSVVFSAFSAQSLKDRIMDAEAKVLITCDGYYRRGKVINLKKSADEAVEGTTIENVVVVRRAGNEINWKEGRDLWYHDLMKEAENYCEPEQMDSEDVLFILYTSGTTGKPKGVVHTSGGYALQALLTTKWVFDLHDEDIFWCTADIGWVTGHTYACYGPLLNGGTQVIYEGAPDTPDWSRWWQIIEKYGINIFYTAPTAIRMFIKMGEKWIKDHDLSTLRVLGSVGEPINLDAWLWYFNVIGGGRCPITDTWWQTETGGTIINSIPGIGPFIPTVACRSFPGVTHDIYDEQGNPTKPGEGGYLVQLSPFAPGMLRNVWGNPERYKKTYFSEYGGKVYFPADGARYTEDGYIKITGRTDDVMKVAGHRLSTGELESVLCGHPAVAEAAVVAQPHDIKGEVPVAFIILKPGNKPSEELEKEIVQQAVKGIGPTGKPAKIIFADDLPKTRSGKIMRRILRALVKNEPLGNLTTLQNPESVEALKKGVGYTGPD
ncbi:MAG: acetate--CoA ligase [Candidatus Odinarchaeia archaeon]